MAALIDTYSMPPDWLLQKYDGASRYISHDSGKCITAGQAQHIHALGKVVSLNFEDSATNAQGGSGQGQNDAHFAVAVARQIGAPAGVAIYASVDYEIHGGPALTTATNYFRGWTPILHSAGYLSGAYGDADLISGLLRAGVIDLGWVTVAWSYGARVRDPRACLLQDQFTPGYDVDEETAAFYGGWTSHGPQETPNNTKDWFEMATKADLAAVINERNGYWLPRFAQLIRFGKANKAFNPANAGGMIDNQGIEGDIGATLTQIQNRLAAIEQKIGA